MEEKKEKRVLSIELDDDVKKVSITGLGDDETVVMKQELSEEELEQATGGHSIPPPARSHNQDGCQVNCAQDEDGSHGNASVPCTRFNRGGCWPHW